jgi:hypothetical protein
LLTQGSVSYRGDFKSFGFFLRKRRKLRAAERNVVNNGKQRIMWWLPGKEDYKEEDS